MCTTSAWSLPAHKVRFQKKAAVQHASFSVTSVNGTPRSSLRILAVMVDFAITTDNLVSGNGSFMQSDVGVIDPTPHDSAYFSNKILLVKNYFKKVSTGQLNISGDVIGPVSLAMPMSSYSPPTNGSDYSKLAQLVFDSWQKADSIFPSVDFSSYDLFVIFHAGTGRDIDLVSLLGYDPTPYDLPSLYFDSTALASALPAEASHGIPITVQNGNGTFNITNSIVLPETESRIVPGLTGPDTLEYSINGLFAACVGNFLGLPDLYNTRSGVSGIGDFGLMDGAGFFAYNGLFPPEPCAWEKINLGWTAPITLTKNTAMVLPAVSLHSSAQDTIYKIPISSTEYFLLENRNRNPLGTGLKITFIKKSLTSNSKDGKIDSLIIPTDMTSFNYSVDSLIAGTVIDVSNYDWAVMGYRDTIQDPTHQYDGGGVLIWHIDESVITNSLASNTVNIDSVHRGIDLEEAGGPQDIGVSLGSGAEDGSAQDCWYQQNPSPIYTNAFGPSTYPSSNSYTGASSLITINNFSIRSAHMTAALQIGGSVCSPYVQFTKTLTTKTPGYPLCTDSTVAIIDSGKIYLFRPNGTSKTSDPTGYFALKGGKNGVVVEENGASFRLVGSQDSSVYIFNAQMNTDGTLSGLKDSIILMDDRITTAPMMLASAPGKFVFGGNSGRLWIVDSLGHILSETSPGRTKISFLTQLPSNTLQYYGTTNSLIFGNGISAALVDSSRPWMTAAAQSSSGSFVVAAQQGGTRIEIFSDNLQKCFFNGVLPVDSITSLAVADIDGDGNCDFIIWAGRQIIAVSRNGIVLDHFPITLYDGSTFTGTPMIINNGGTSAPEIFAATSSGVLRGYQNNGTVLNGFPVQISAAGQIYPALFKTGDSKLGVLAVNAAGSISAEEINSPYSLQNLLWSQFGKDATHSNYAVSPSSAQALSTNFFPKDRLYNWPNPVYGSTTHIRYYVAEDAAISVKIFDVAGTSVTELHGTGKAGFDNEILWDVSRIQTGVYLARVEAKSSNHTASAIIKIAVVK